jgi:hypothetical protein
VTALSYDPNNLAQWWESRQTEDNRHWVRISAEAGDLVRTHTGREDLIVAIEPGFGKGHPAVFIPEQAKIEIDPDVCVHGINPRDIHLDSEVGQLEHPSLVGGLDHEGGHSEFTLWPIDQTPSKRRVVQTALLIEEPLMERDILRSRPHRRVFLRSTFHSIVNKGDEPIDSVASAAHMAALVGGRIDAGVLDADEVAPVMDVVKAILGDRYEQFRQIWLDGMAIPLRTDAAEMEALGQRWLDLLGDDAEEGDGGEGETLVFVCGEPRDGDSSGDGEGEGNGTGGLLAKVADQVSQSAEQEAAEQVDAAKVRDIVAARKAEAADGNKDDATASEVFDKKIIFVGHGYGYGSEGLSSQRNPTPVERAQANVLAADLRKAQHRDRSKTTVSSTLPPGRLNSTAAVRRSAERSQGMISTAQPWRATKRKRVPNPPITVGIACDISGSMSSATAAVASAAWVIAHAVHRNEGDSATVAYGEKVHAVVKPGESPDKVRDFAANGGMENWTGAMRAMNGSLFRGATGVKLAVFISDGHYIGKQHEDGNKMVAKLMRDGVKVLWIGFDGRSERGSYGGDIVPEGAEYVRIGDPSQMGKVIGQAMVRLLEKA